MDTNVCSLKNNNDSPTTSMVTVSGSVVCEPRGMETYLDNPNPGVVTRSIVK
jgi:hypothetical protein